MASIESKSFVRSRGIRQGGTAHAERAERCDSNATDRMPVLMHEN
jgi:hypothetical protein